MSDEDWKESYEENGITLGPEEALRREIEKSKNLKVDRLRLKDEIEKLRLENVQLINSIEAQKKEIQNQHPISPKNAPPSFPKLSLFLLVFNLCALGTLLYFLSQK